MTGRLTLCLAAGALALAACTTSPTQDELLGGFAGAALGAITAEALLEDDDWVILGALAGAAAGTLIARNAEEDRCAYATTSGSYVVRRC